MLRDIVSSEAVSQFFRPGRRQHFFAADSTKHEYTYGPGGDFDTDLFSDGTPIDVEDIFFRQGATISSNELIPNGSFNDLTGWSLQGSLGSSSDLTAANGKMRWLHSTEAASSTVRYEISPTLSLSVGRTYNLSFDAEVIRGGQFPQGGPIGFYNSGTGTAPADFNLTSGDLSTSGRYEYSYQPSAVTNQLWLLAYPSSGPVDFTIDNLSLLEVGKSERELSSGTDYPLRRVDRNAYNSFLTKQSSGRPGSYFYSREYPLARLFFEQAPQAGDVIVIDCLTGPTPPERLSDDIPLYGEGIKYLKYRLAFEFAPTVGKAMPPQQVSVMRDAFRMTRAANSRPDDLRLDLGLQARSHYDIDRGDY